MSNLDYPAKQLNKIRKRIEKAALAAGRDAREIKLVGASKMQAHGLIRDFADAGLKSIGENYLQEAIEKRAHLDDLSLEWHFIGHIQSNKTKLIAEHFSWVHGVDRLKIAKRLSTQNPSNAPLNLLLQLNLDEEDSKSGVDASKAPRLCDEIAQLENINLRGLMLIPKPRSDVDALAAPFAQAQDLLTLTNQRFGLHMDSLSMGMSGDLEIAIAEGSTMVRIGTDLFGARKK